MWKLVKISNHLYLMKCTFGADDKVTLILYDNKESLCETLTREELKRKAKILNRRYDFSEENVRDTLADGDPELVTLEQQYDGTRRKMLLKLKYRVKNCPFHFEWTLKDQTMAECQALFIKPLCSALKGCHEQIEILTEALKKKDAEILQYRKEGAILSRKTLATKLFGFDEFAKKYEDNNKVAVEFSDMVNYFESVDAKQQIKSPTKEKQEVTEKKESGPKNPTTASLSPGQRKRKIQELKQKHLERNLKTKQQNIVYESSQSQETSSGGSQSTEVSCEIERVPAKVDAKSPQPKLEDKLDKVKSKIDQSKNQDLNSTITNETNAPEMAKNHELNCSSSKKVDKTDMSPQKKKFINAVTDKTSQKTETICVPQQLPGNSSPSSVAKKRKIVIEDRDSDSEDSNDVILTPSKLTELRRKRGRPPSVIKSDTESESCDLKKIKENLKKSTNEEKEKDNNNVKSKNVLNHKAVKSLTFDTIVEISTTDSDDSETVKNKLSTSRYPKRRNTTTTPTKTKSRATRSSPQSTTPVENHTPRRRNSIASVSANFKIFDTPTNSNATASETKVLIVDDISSQLDAIRKELKSLEALRLADLKQRTS